MYSISIDLLIYRETTYLFWSLKSTCKITLLTTRNICFKRKHFVYEICCIFNTYYTLNPLAVEALKGTFLSLKSLASPMSQSVFVVHVVFSMSSPMLPSDASRVEFHTWTGVCKHPPPSVTAILVTSLPASIRLCCPPSMVPTADPLVIEVRDWR